MTILKITKQPYIIFDDWYFMDVLIEENGIEHECSIVEPLISQVLNNELPFLISENNSIQLKLF